MFLLSYPAHHQSVCLPQSIMGLIVEVRKRNQSPGVAGLTNEGKTSKLAARCASSFSIGLLA